MTGILYETKTDKLEVLGKLKDAQIYRLLLAIQVKCILVMLSRKLAN